MRVRRRLAIFVHYDRDNIVDDYVIDYLSRLKQVTADIQFVSNSALEETQLAKIVPYVSQITLRQNIGFDFGAWQEVILTLRLQTIAEQYDELVLANDSCYACFSDFSAMFDAMSDRCCDAWGITENKAPSYGSGESTLTIVPHVQSYFLVFKQSVLRAACFYDYWHGISPASSYDDLILNCEVRLTKFLREQRFTIAVYCPYQEKDIEDICAVYGQAHYDLTRFYWRELINRGSPFLKVKALALADKYNRQTLTAFKSELRKQGNIQLFEMLHQHLQRTSMRYRFYQSAWYNKPLYVLCYAIKKILNWVTSSLRYCRLCVK